MTERIALVERATKETKIKLSLNIDGSGKCECNTGVGFFDHMIDAFARHGLFDIELVCEGDLHVDVHHTVEDIGIVLGEAFKKAVGGKEGIKRYGYFLLPMDDALVMAAVDLSGRPFFVNDIEYTTPKIGDMDTEVFYDFFYSFAYSAEINLHLKKAYGFNNHHIAEASFKALAKALDTATSYDERINGVLSTKGSL